MITLADSLLFEGIDPECIEDLLVYLEAHEELFEQGSMLFSEGEVMSEIGLVLSGSAHVVQHDFWGNASIVSELAAGEVFGVSSASPGASDLGVHGLALAPTRVLYLSTERILSPNDHSCVGHERLVCNFARVLAHKCNLLNRKITHSSKRTTRGKVLSYLSEQAQQAGSAFFTIPFNRQQLADYLEVDRVALSKVLSQMKVEGVLDYDRSTFRLLKPERA